MGCIAVLSLFAYRVTSLTIPQYGGMVTNIMLCTFVFVLGYFSFKQQSVFISLDEDNVE